MPALKILGAFCILAFAAFASEAYRNHQKAAFSELEGFLLFLRFLKEEIGCFLTPCDEIYQKFRNDGLEACGFLPLLREKNSLSEALAFSQKELSLPSDAQKILTDYAERLGKGYREEEIERADYAISRILPIYETERGTLQKNIRLARVLSLSGAVMLILWLL